MPRKPRAWEPGDILSVVGRAHEGRPIFVDDDDRRFFADRLRRVFVDTDVQLLAWSLLINHYHLTIRLLAEPPGSFFLRFNTVLAQRVRRRRGDHGAVFQDRYWSRGLEDDERLLTLLTYVLGNPVHHGVLDTVEELELYPWTAYPELLGLTRPGLVDPATTLRLVDPDPAAARAALRRAMDIRVAAWRSQLAGIDLCDEPGCTGQREGCLLVHGRRRRATAPSLLLPAALEPASAGDASLLLDVGRDRLGRLLARGWGTADLVAAVCARLGAEARGVAAGRRTPPESQARAIVAHVAYDGLGLSAATVAALAGVGGTALPAARRRGRALLLSRGWTVEGVLAWAPPLA